VLPFQGAQLARVLREDRAQLATGRLPKRRQDRRLREISLSDDRELHRTSTALLHGSNLRRNLVLDPVSGRRGHPVCAASSNSRPVRSRLVRSRAPLDSSRLPSANSRRTNPGSTATATRPTRAETVSTSCDCPRAIASTIRRAARRADIAVMGLVARARNQASSRSTLPLK